MGSAELTGLLGREALGSIVAAALERSELGTTGVALACLDIDDFQRVNEVLGHAAGDELLRAVAERLTSVIRPADRVVHFGGDKFIASCTGIQNDQDALRIAHRLSSSLEEPFLIGETPLALTACVGVALGDGLSKSPDDLLRDSDTALSRAKGRGRGSVVIFDETQRRSAVARLQLENALRTSLDRNDLTLAYQPIVSLHSGGVVGFEALTRWDHPALGPVSPLEFIPVAEESGLIHRLGRLVFTRACTDLALLVDRYGERFHMSVNLSPRQVLDPSLPGDLMAIIDATGIDPERLHVELTEGVLIEHDEAARAALVRLRQTGVRLVIDDFGTGYSALSYLTRLPVDGVKIDRSFVQELDRNTPEAAIVAALVSLSQELGLHVIAEGVETEEQAARLRQLGCPLAQGFYFGRPTPAEYVDLLL